MVRFGGLRIGGLSGIYKDQHYGLVGGAACSLVHYCDLCSAQG